MHSYCLLPVVVKSETKLSTSWKYYLQHERPRWISIYKLKLKARVVYLIQHGRKFTLYKTRKSKLKFMKINRILYWGVQIPSTFMISFVFSSLIINVFNKVVYEHSRLVTICVGQRVQTLVLHSKLCIVTKLRIIVF